MSLATRCFACGTVFRVVQDQLKVSEGWVRCGRCNEVFNALETLFDLERDTPPEWSPGEQTPVMIAPPGDAPADRRLDLATEHSRADRIDAHLLGTRRRESESTPAGRVGERDRLEFPDAEFEPESIAWGGPMFDARAAPAASPSAEPEGASPRVAPEFIRHAQRRARWQNPLTRAALGIIGFVLSGMLAVQAANHFRDLAAARWPAMKPTLLAWCEWRGCSIEAPKRIDDIAVESTSLTRAPEGDAFRLSVTLRNRGAIALALPSVDLTLTDAAGQLVARRVLAPIDFRSGVAPIQAGAELPLQLLLSSGSARITGYTVEIFYP
ncbi:MAG: zinc-ribbon and DUF3426 domain-containing protein [Burkholderiales bacterium]